MTQKTSSLYGGTEYEEPISPYEITFHRNDLRKLIKKEGIGQVIKNAKEHIERTIREINRGDI